MPGARLTVLAGPSGVGKGTVVAALRRIAPQVWISVSCTTRAPRAGETDGVEYRFVDRAEFARLRESGDLLESDEHFGNWYGTPRQPVLDHLAAGTPTLLEIELQGARQVREKMPEAVQVFIAPPSGEALKARLVGRGTDTQEQVQRRLETAAAELAAQPEFPHVVVNDRLEDAVDALVTIVQRELATT